jgi:hypothetical protein
MNLGNDYQVFIVEHVDQVVHGAFTEGTFNFE